MLLSSCEPATATVKGLFRWLFCTKSGLRSSVKICNFQNVSWGGGGVLGEAREACPSCCMDKHTPLLSSPLQSEVSSYATGICIQEAINTAFCGLGMPLGKRLYFCILGICFTIKLLKSVMCCLLCINSEKFSIKSLTYKEHNQIHSIVVLHH